MGRTATRQVGSPSDLAPDTTGKWSHWEVSLHLLAYKVWEDSVTPSASVVSESYFRFSFLSSWALGIFSFTLTISGCIPMTGNGYHQDQQHQARICPIQSQKPSSETALISPARPPALAWCCRDPACCLSGWWVFSCWCFRRVVSSTVVRFESKNECAMWNYEERWCCAI